MSVFRRVTSLRLLSFVLIMIFCSACDINEEGQEITFSQAEYSVIGGVSASNPSMDATGAIIYSYLVAGEEKQSEDPLKLKIEGKAGSIHYPGRIIEEENYLVCSASLIGPTTILTAGHCSPSGQYFAVGPDIKNPKKKVRISGWAESIVGDIAVAHLEEPINDIKPLSIGTFSDNQIHDLFVAVGYGEQNSAGDHGTRMAGSVALRGIHGNIFDMLFGDYAGFRKAATRDWDDPPQGVNPIRDKELLAMYQRGNLLDDYEALLGYMPDNAQLCYGDSGGPIMRKNSSGELIIYGLTSSGYSSKYLQCDWGVIVATFGPLAKEFIAKELACPMVPSTGKCEKNIAVHCFKDQNGEPKIEKVNCEIFDQICGYHQDNGKAVCLDDPCSDIPVGGYCDGNIAVRCSNEKEGLKRVLRTDCSIIGEMCTKNSENQVTCNGTVVAN